MFNGKAYKTKTSELDDKFIKNHPFPLILKGKKTVGMNEMLRSSACKQEKYTAEAKVCTRVHFLNGDCNCVHFSVCVCGCV